MANGIKSPGQPPAQAGEVPGGEEHVTLGPQHSASVHRVDLQVSVDLAGSKTLSPVHISLSAASHVVPGVAGGGGGRGGVESAIQVSGVLGAVADTLW